MCRTVTLKSRISLIWRLVLPAPGRDGQHAQPLAAVVDAQAAGEQAVPGHVLADVGLAAAAGIHGPGHEVGPAVQVVLGVEDRRGCARGAGGGVQPDEVVQGPGQQAVRDTGRACRPWW